MNDLTNIPTRLPQIDRWSEVDALDDAVEDNCCDLCCGRPVADVIEGDRMCAACADKWERRDRADDDLVPLSHPSMQQAIAHYKQVVRDAELLKLSKGQRAFNRERL